MSTSTVSTRAGIAWTIDQDRDRARTVAGTYTVTRMPRAQGWEVRFLPDVAGAREVSLSDAPVQRVYARAQAQRHHEAIMRGETV